MLKYIARRLLMLIPVLLGVILLVFSLMYITPGDPVDSLLGDNATPEAREALREELGLNGGYFERFFNYVVRLLVTTHNSCQNGHIHQNTPGKPELSKVLPR